MRLRSALLALIAAVGAVSVVPASAVAARPYSVKTLHFDTIVGPKSDHHCDVVGDLYRPDGATHADPAPAVLMTNGFGGSKDDQAGYADALARHGYVALSYSGLGFGGSGCRIQLDDRDWDGKAGSQLITFLGGGSRAKDGTRVNYVVTDSVAHDGRAHRFDPRVGMIGGSYGGQVQFAIAGVDPRLDTIVPVITWNDLAYSLVPNGTDFARGVTSATPGVPKFIWATLFFALGEIDGLQGLMTDTARIGGGCPNFDPRVCPAFAMNAALNTPTRETLHLLRHASVTSFMDRIRIPTLLAQGENDTLFNLNESVATYRALKKRGVPVSLIWQSWGHSGGTPAPGEFDGGDPQGTYEWEGVQAWFDHYLKDKGAEPDLGFCFFRDWIHYDADDTAAPAYRCGPRFPAGDRTRLYLSGSDSLVSKAGSVRSGKASFVAPPEVPTSYTEVSAVDPGFEPIDVPGTFAAFASAPLKANLDVAGIPTVRVRMSMPLQEVTGAIGAPGFTVLFFKLFDVAPDGTVTLPNKLVAPVRVPVTDEAVKVQLPGIVHRFAKGHHLELVIAGSDLAYRGNIAPQAVTIVNGPRSPGTLTLPVLGS